jgi:hypothetical protein
MQEHKEAWTAARKHLPDQIRARITMDVVGMRVASKRGLMRVREIWIWDLYAAFGGWRDGRVGQRSGVRGLGIFLLLLQWEGKG